MTAELTLQQVIDKRGISILEELWQSYENNYISPSEIKLALTILSRAYDGLTDRDTIHLITKMVEEVSETQVLDKSIALRKGNGVVVFGDLLGDELTVDSFTINDGKSTRYSFEDEAIPSKAKREKLSALVAQCLREGYTVGIHV